MPANHVMYNIELSFHVGS